MENIIQLNNSKNGMITQGRMYGLYNALRVSGFPMQIEDKVESDVQMLNRGIKLGSTPSGGR